MTKRPEKDGGGRPPRTPLSTESVGRDIARLLKGREFGSIDEVNAFLAETLAGGGLPPAEAETPIDRAQDLVYGAWEEPSAKRQVTLARQALEISSDCADAYVILAESETDPRRARVLLGEAVAAGERALGDDFASLAAEGRMWGAIESRPYMRARTALAELCWAMGDRQEAIAHGWELLRLNPDDNQGTRYVLLVWLLAAGTIEQVERLFSTYPDDGSAAWTYGRALHEYRIGGPGGEANAALAAALRANAHVPGFLTGSQRLPDVMPEYIGFGDASEAMVYVDTAMTLWFEVRGALEWLAERAAAGPGRSRKPKKRK